MEINFKVLETNIPINVQTDNAEYISISDEDFGVYPKNYNILINKPKINNVELNDNKTLEDLGITSPTNYVTTDTVQTISANKTLGSEEANDDGYIFKVKNGSGSVSVCVSGSENGSVVIDSEDMQTYYSNNEIKLLSEGKQTTYTFPLGDESNNEFNVATTDDVEIALEDYATTTDLSETNARVEALEEIVNDVETIDTLIGGD